MNELEQFFEEWWQKQLKIGWCTRSMRGIAKDAFMYGRKTAPEQTPMQPDVQQLNEIIKLLENSFNKASETMEKDISLNSIKVSCTELAVSNAEARQKLENLST